MRLETAIMQLNDRIALITGGTRGIGAASAFALARAGANVALVARHDGQHATLVRESVAALGRRSELILADISSPSNVSHCVDVATRRLGPIDVLVHCAGGPAPGNILELEPATWQHTFDVHVHAAFYLCRAVLPMMRERHQGAIVLISSAAGIRGCPGSFAYQVAKGALPQFARALARDFAADNIRINCVAPGIIRTEFHKAMTLEQLRNNLENRIPLAREGTPEQVAELINHLVTNDYITGETIAIDGGLTMRIA
jgi:NAD(P)-dependent dehydrogenase (short-subunit alcohol dehydrogenase family)